MNPLLAAYVVGWMFVGGVATLTTGTGSIDGGIGLFQAGVCISPAVMLFLVFTPAETIVDVVTNQLKQRKKD